MAAIEIGDKYVEEDHLGLPRILTVATLTTKRVMFTPNSRHYHRDDGTNGTLLSVHAAGRNRTTVHRASVARVAEVEKMHLVHHFEYLFDWDKPTTKQLEFLKQYLGD